MEYCQSGGIPWRCFGSLCWSMVPMLYVLDMCYSGKYTKAEMLRKMRGEGGMSALLGTHDCQES